MKRLVLILTGTVLATALAFSQAAGPQGQAKGQAKGQGDQVRAGQRGQGGPGQGGPDRAAIRERMQKMQKEIYAQLKLSADQTKKVEALDKATAKKLDDLRAAPGDRQSKGPKMREIRDAHQKDLEKILTKAQADQFKKLRQEQMDKMRAQFGGGRDRGGPGGPGGPPAGGAKAGAAKTGGGKGGGA